MLEINFKIKSNEFFKTHPGSALTDTLIDHLSIPYGYILLEYPNWGQSDIDLFQFLELNFLDKLRYTKTILIVDYTFEGFSPKECPIIQILENNCKKYNINPKKIFYFSGNLKDRSNFINVIPIFLLDCNNHFKKLERNLEKIQNRCILATKNKIFLSLSRRNRTHRVLAHAMLNNSSLKNHVLISQDKIPNIIPDDLTLKRIGYTRKKWDYFSQSLPLIADRDQFHINKPFDMLSSLHYQTYFSIVNETLINDFDETSLFFSEKILKPIVNFQPMVIYGQPGINHALRDLGFKIYDKYFDLSFDFEKDSIIRYKKLLQSIKPVVDNISKLSVAERIEWRFKHTDILEHNFDNFLQKTHSTNAVKIFASRIAEL